MTGALLSFEQVSKVYAGPPSVTALQPTDLTISHRDYVAIMGPSGSGKSTMLNLLGMLDRPSTGVYRIEGIETTNLDDDAVSAMRSHYFGFVFQAFHLVAYRTCLENVMLGSIYRRIPRDVALGHARWALARVGLEAREGSFPDALSGGQRQRVAIARALAVKPSVLLCDEPTGNLDTRTSNEILDLIEELRSEALTVLMVTHEPRIAERADSTIWIEDGIVSQKAVATNET